MRAFIFVAFSIIFFIQTPAANALPRLLAWYKLDGNFKDSSGNGYDLTPVSADNTFSEDSYIKSSHNLCFGPVILPSRKYGATGPELPLDNNTGFTISGFVACPSQNSYHATLFGSGAEDHRKPGALFYSPWGVIHSKVGETLKHAWQRMNDGKWRHYALVVPPQKPDACYAVYVDGKPVYSSLAQYLPKYGKFSIGLLEGKQTPGFKIDEVKVFAGALTPDEVKNEAAMTGVKQPEKLDGSGILRRIKPAKYDFPLRGKLSIHFLSDQWICVVGDYNDFIRERFKTECGKFLNFLDTGAISVPAWSYDFHYNFAAVEVINDYRPRIKHNFENPAYFSLQTSAGEKIPFAANSYWINAVGQMRVPIIATGNLKMVNSAAVAHFAYLKLSKPLANNVSYLLNSESGEKIDFKYNDQDAISQAIKVNQVGYLPEAGRKYAYLGSWLACLGAMDFSAWNKKSFFLVDEATGKNAFSGQIALRSMEQFYTGTPGLKIPINGENVYQMDFSTFTAPGKYHIYIPGVGRSWSFEISRNAIGEAFYTHIRGLFHQRSGIAKKPPQTNWRMDADHMTSWVGGFSPDSADYSTKRTDGYGYLNEKGEPVTLNHFDVVRETATKTKLPNVYGGWWDAGDFDRRPYHFRIVCDLLAAYLMFPEKFSDGQLNIPESGNNIPDIIDEAAWGVDVWRRAQNAQGGVGCWLEADSHPKEFNPAKDKQRYYLALPTRGSTIEYAAHAAMLANAYKQCGATAKAELFMKSAEKAFSYAMNPANQITHSWKHYVPEEKRYADYTFKEPPEIDQAMVFKAAFNLYLLTHDEKYLRELTRERFDQALKEIDYPQNPFFMIEAGLANQEFPEYAAEYKKEVKRLADKWLGYQEQSAYRNLNWPANHPYFRNLEWGNAIPFNKGRAFIAAYRFSGNYKYRDAALLLNDWMCGANPMGRSLTTGLGQIYPVNILSLPVYSQGNQEAFPGISIYAFTFRVDYNAKKMVYGLDYEPRRDHDFTGIKTCLTPDALSQGKFLDYDQMSNIMDNMYPVWRRFANIEEYAVPQNEFTVWETIGPSAAVLGCLLPDGWKPPTELKERKPAENREKIPGYLFQP